MELSSRQALLNEGCQKFKDLKIDVKTRMISVGDKSVRLTPTTFRVVEEMLLPKDNLLHRDEYFKKIYGSFPKNGDSHPLRAHISQLNNRLLKGFNIRIDMDEEHYYSLIQKDAQ